MRRYKYLYKDIGLSGNIETSFSIKTEREVLESFYQQWLDMNAVSGRPERTSKEECIQDWVALYNALELRED